jgi:hypothetical protein
MSKSYTSFPPKEPPWCVVGQFYFTPIFALNTTDVKTGMKGDVDCYIEDWRSTTASHMVPPSGLDFLRGVNELYIQQTVELVDRKLLLVCISLSNFILNFSFLTALMLFVK